MNNDELRDDVDDEPIAEEEVCGAGGGWCALPPDHTDAHCTADGRWFSASGARS